MADSSTNSITISNFLYSSVTSGKTFAFTIYDLNVRNPPTTKASPAILIATAQNGSEVDSSDTTVVYPTPTIISAVSITPSSLVTSATDITYVFTMDIAGYLLTSTYI